MPGDDKMSSGKRKDLQGPLCHYTTDMLISIHTVREFCEEFPNWELWRETELEKLMDIKDRIDTLDLKISHVYNSEEKCKAFLKFIKSKVSADSRRAELEKELTEILEHSLRGLEKLEPFLDALEKLAVTSLQVFTENLVLHLPEGITFEHVQDIIRAAKQICPLLLEFKRDSKEFFLPKLENVDVLAYQLDRYIVTSQKICEKMEKSSISDVRVKIVDTVVDLNKDLCEDDIQYMLSCIYRLNEIRMDPNFRMVFLFKEESGQDFIIKFEERQSRMLDFLNELEQCAVELDKMSKGAKISGVAGSSIGAIAGVLSIVGLALIPVTAGVSLSLTMAGFGLGITSGVNTAVTTAAEIGVNHKHQTKANEVFGNFMKDVQSLQDCLQEAANQPVSGVGENDIDMAMGVSKFMTKVGTIGKGIDSLVGAASNMPHIGKVAAKGSLALSKSARAGFIALNALFLGMDIFFIYKDSKSLANGCETKVSQFIRARAALWSSEIDSWQKIHKSLKEGWLTSEKKQKVLEAPFYLGVVKKQRKREKLSQKQWLLITTALAGLLCVCGVILSLLLFCT